MSVKGGLKKFGKGARVKKGVGLNKSTLCDTSRVPELHGKVFPIQRNPHSAVVLYRLTGHTLCDN